MLFFLPQPFEVTKPLPTYPLFKLTKKHSPFIKTARRSACFSYKNQEIDEISQTLCCLFWQRTRKIRSLATASQLSHLKKCNLGRKKIKTDKNLWEKRFFKCFYRTSVGELQNRVRICCNFIFVSLFPLNYSLHEPWTLCHNVSCYSNKCLSMTL